MYRVHGDKIIRRRTNYRKANDIQRYTKILREDFGNMCGYCGKDFNIINCPYQKDHLIPEDIAKKVGRLDLLTDYNIWFIHAVSATGISGIIGRLIMLIKPMMTR